VLHNACTGGHVDVIDLLLKKGAEINKQNDVSDILVIVAEWG